MNNNYDDGLSDRQIVVLMIVGAILGVAILPIIIVILSGFGL